MEEKRLLILAALTIQFITVPVAFALDNAKIIKRGNDAYKASKYDLAIDFYNQAQGEQSDSAVISFDLGAAQFKKGEYLKASSSFERSLATEKKDLEAKASYNLANSKYKLSQQNEESDLMTAVDLMQQAVDSYKRSIVLDPKDKDSKVNYELAVKKLAQLKEKLKEQPPQDSKEENNQCQRNQPDKQGQSQEKEEQKKQQKEQSNKDQSEKHGQEKLPSEKKEEQKQGTKNNESQEQAGENKAGGTKQMPQEKEGQDNKEMSEQEANMILDNYRNEETSFGKIEDKRKGSYERVLKDW